MSANTGPYLHLVRDPRTYRKVYSGTDWSRKAACLMDGFYGGGQSTAQFDRPQRPLGQIVTLVIASRQPASLDLFRWCARSCVLDHTEPALPSTCSDRPGKSMPLEETLLLKSEYHKA